MHYIKKLPGFRSGSRPRMIVATVIYVVIIAAVIRGATGNSSIDKPAADAAVPSATAVTTRAAATTPVPATATAQPSAVSTQAVLVTDAGLAFVSGARAYLGELESQIVKVDSRELDEIAWSRWVHDWNTRLNADYQTCLAGTPGLRGCQPLDLVRRILVAEHNRLWKQGDPAIVTELRGQLTTLLTQIDAG